jgi:hypothetical protein
VCNNFEEENILDTKEMLMSLFRKQVLCLIVIQQSLLSNTEPDKIDPKNWIPGGSADSVINFVISHLEIPAFESSWQVGTIDGLVDEFVEYFHEPSLESTRESTQNALPAKESTGAENRRIHSNFWG